MGDASGGGTETPSPRPETVAIAKYVLLMSGLAILLLVLATLGGAAFSKSGAFTDTARYVFNALLPLLGTWVGTVLAYYFSKSNFESASQSVERMVSLTVEQKLGKLSVDKEMIPLGKITLETIPAGKTAKDILLKDLIPKFGGNITRLPVVDDKGVVQYIVHQSGLSKFIADQALSGKTANLQTLTLADLAADAELNRWISNIVFAAQGATVAQAKTLMESQSGCQDLVVTATGSRTEPMVGWMTNVDIGRLSKA